MTSKDLVTGHLTQVDHLSEEMPARFFCCRVDLSPFVAANYFVGKYFETMSIATPSFRFIYLFIYF